MGLLFGLNIPACAATGASGATLAAGFGSLAVFGFALSAPLVAAVLFARARRLLDWLARWTGRFPKWSGVLLIALGAWSIRFGLYVDAPLT